MWPSFGCVPLDIQSFVLVPSSGQFGKNGVNVNDIFRLALWGGNDFSGICWTEQLIFQNAFSPFND